VLILESGLGKEEDIYWRIKLKLKGKYGDNYLFYRLSTTRKTRSRTPPTTPLSTPTIRNSIEGRRRLQGI